MEEYNSAYYTPNPYSLRNSMRNKNDNQSNFGTQENDKS